MKIALRITGIAVLAIVLIILFLRFYERGITTTDAYITGHVHPISARVTGTVVELLIDDNQHVEAGQVIVRIDADDFKARDQQARAQISQGKSAQESAVAQREQAEAAMASARAVIQRTKLDLDRDRQLINETPRGISTQEYDAAVASYDTSVAAGKSAAAQRAAALAAFDAGQAQIALGNANLFDADLSLKYTDITAPVTGFVGQRTVENGARINAGQTLLSLVSEDVWIVANYKETQLKGIKPGSPVEVTVDAIPDVKLNGVVDSFSPASGAQFALLPPDNATGNFTKVVQRVPVKIRIDPSDFARYRSRLLPGLSVVTHVLPKS
jgi:membrane fusion protein (multidrug efflux system)